MAWYDEWPWGRRQAGLVREELVTSVEEGTEQQSLGDKEWDEENIVQTSNTSPVLPRLRLQSRLAGMGGASLTQPIPALGDQKQPETRSVETPQVAEQHQRLAGRSTRVRLQTVHPGSPPETFTGHVPAVDMSSGQQRQTPPGGLSAPGAGVSPAQNNNQPSAEPYGRPWPHLLAGRGMLKRGQGAVTVPNAAITERCVVTVMLASNPGPVVVHYVSLHPRMGFTVHLSSPATADAPFNYVIWPF